MYFLLLPKISTSHNINVAEYLRISLGIVAAVLMLVLSGVALIVTLRITCYFKQRKRMKNIFDEIEQIHNNQSGLMSKYS